MDSQNAKTIDPETGEITETQPASFEAAGVVSKERAGFFVKLTRAAARIERLPKEGYNDILKFHFTTEAAVSEAVREALTSEGIAFLVNLNHVERLDGGLTNAGKQRIRTVVYFTVTFGDIDTGYVWTVNWQGEALDTEDKGLPKALTTGIKYLLIRTFLIPTGEMSDDVDFHGDEEPRQTRPAQRRQPQARRPQGKKTQPQAGSKQSAPPPEPETPPEENGEDKTEDKAEDKTGAGKAEERRQAVIARLKQLSDQMAGMGLRVAVDSDWLKTAEYDDLITEGKRLKKIVTQAEAKTARQQKEAA